MKRIAVITSGGDAPGMNAAVRAVVREAIYSGLEVLGVQRGYKGLLENQLIRLSLRSVSGIINRGGTILKTGRCPEMKTAAGLKKAVKNLKNNGIEGLVGIGGDGSLKAAMAISNHGIPAVSIPASIDNDVYGTDETIGFDTAMDTAVEAIDKIRDTAASHERIFIVEVMGREHGFLALSIGLASGAEFILIPEVKYNTEKICAQLKRDYHKGKTSVIIVFAEGVGNPYELAEKINKRIGIDVRVSSLGYIQRGGTPQARSRILACMYGAHAVKLLLKKKTNRLVVLKDGKVTDIPFSMVLNNEKKINMSLYKLAMELSI
ncbi:MAG: 6-phosphofructokinase [Elusimicrobiota bacterium]